MLVYYIAPSQIPSKSANSIHVIRMCEGFIKNKCKVKLFFSSQSADRNNIEKIINSFYGIKDNKVKYIYFKSIIFKGDELIISLFSTVSFFKDILFKKKPNFILSRNIFATFILGTLLKQKIIYETHTLETGYRRFIQNLIFKYSNFPVVVISNALKIILQNNFNINSPIYVLHDAAKEGSNLLTKNEKLKYKKEIFEKHKGVLKYKKFIGYFGHLYQGRGIDLIYRVSTKLNNCAFIVFGGNETSVEDCIKKFKSKNLFFLGHVPAYKVLDAMKCMDILLMPYQNNVSIGVKSIDTSKWMSPLKMFEYMSSGVPIISSNIKVLKEVLIDKENSILLDPIDHMQWVNSIKMLLNNSYLRNKIRKNAFSNYKEKYNWTMRSKIIINIASKHF